MILDIWSNDSVVCVPDSPTFELCCIGKQDSYDVFFIKQKKDIETTFNVFLEKPYPYYVLCDFTNRF